MTGESRRPSRDDVTHARDLPGTGPAPYWGRSREPLQILAFVLPLVLIYEIGVFTAWQEGGLGSQLLAYRWVEEAFEAMGLAAAGTALPAILVVLSLLAWQVMSRRPWRIHGPTVLAMTVESVVLAMPLLLFASLVSESGTVASAGDGPGGDLGMRLVASIGAGIYEEFLFRWILIATLLAIFVDGLRMPKGLGVGISVVVSSVLFMLAHEPSDAGQRLFYLGCGVFFSVIYVVREFGIAVGCHAAYDIIVELLAGA